MPHSTCSVLDCEKRVSATGLCSAHYSRKRRHGSETARLSGEIRDGKRVCSKCLVDTPLDRMGKGGADSWCLDCYASNRRENHPYKPKVTEVADCIACGATFPANRKQTLHCSKECRKATVHSRNWKHVQARRARLKEVLIESFTRNEILVRDAWTCRICGTAIDPELRRPDQMSASIDHIIPIARGGTHERSNVQAAHLACNVSKGVKLVA